MKSMSRQVRAARGSGLTFAERLELQRLEARFFVYFSLFFFLFLPFFLSRTYLRGAARAPAARGSFIYLYLTNYGGNSRPNCGRP